jgi:outer membrane protein assembly factor BamB
MRTTRTLAAMLLCLAAVQPAAAAAKSGCAPADHPGGAWPSLNHDLANTRTQPRERTIGVDDVDRLAPVWRFDVAEHGAPGGIQSTPIVAYGCVYIATGAGAAGLRGDVFALNADTGALVWRRQIPGQTLGLAAANGLIYAFPSTGITWGFEPPVPTSSRAMAMDARTGKVAWTSVRLDDGTMENGWLINASPLVYEVGGRSILFAPLSGGSEAEAEAGYGGSGIWATAAFDPTTGHLYAGTADSDGYHRQHRFNNAVLKIDGDVRRPTFGSVVDAYAGVSEHYDLDKHGYEGNPICDDSDGELLPYIPLPTFDNSQATECLELDLDFGASPNLFRDRQGRLSIAAMQKAGVLHGIRADTMEGAWRWTLAPPSQSTSGATGAVSGGIVFAKSTPNAIFSFDGSDGTPRWASTTGTDIFAYQPLTYANGVLYGLNNFGVLTAFDAETGRVLLHRPVGLDVGGKWCGGAGSGVAVARNTVFAPCDAGMGGLPGAGPGALVAYRL